jgi:DNA-binding NarL/FixJ family response regulator
MREAIRVAVVDDHPVTCQGMAALINTLPGLSVVCTLCDSVDLTPDDAIDVVVHDLYLADGAPAVRAVERISTFARVLVMSASRAPGDILAVVRAGACGYVVKDTAPDALLAALNAVAVGGFALSPNLADILVAALGQAPALSQAPVDRLSPREHECLDLIAAGFTHAQAARRMDVSKSTVDTYVERIRMKLQVGNKAELTRIALAPGGPAAR